MNFYEIYCYNLVTDYEENKRYFLYQKNIKVSCNNSIKIEKMSKNIMYDSFRQIIYTLSDIKKWEKCRMKKVLNENIKNKKIEENFFDDKILDLTSMRNAFLQMPTMICFNFCLKEMLDLCNVNSETGNKKYFELAKDFLGFLKKDTVLKELDMGAYINTIKKLNEFINNRDKINCTELYHYFSHMKVIFGNKYRRKLAELLIENIEECKNYQILKI